MFKRKPRHGQAGDVTSDVPTARSAQHPVDSEVLVQGQEFLPIQLTDACHLLLSKVSILFTACAVTVGTLGQRKDNVGWPQELLSKEEPLSHVHVLMLGYDALSTAEHP